MSTSTHNKSEEDSAESATRTPTKSSHGKDKKKNAVGSNNSNDKPPAPLPQRVATATLNFIKITFAVLTSPRLAREKSVLLWSFIKKEAKHFWAGSKLLATDVRTATRLIRRVLNGHSLTRRERKQLLRTASDLFRLVPFTIIMLTPFLEFLLPFILKLFPNMLPSTFQSKHAKTEQLKRQLKVRLEMADFLQETVQHMAEELSRKSSVGSDKHTTSVRLVEILNKVRIGEAVPNEQILEVTKLFKDEMTLDHVNYDQLKHMCRMMGLRPYGTAAFLRAHLRFKLVQIRTDDRAIRAEGVDTLDKDELQAALRERGMRTYGLSPWACRNALERWLDLSLNHELPASLLIMSRAFTLSEEVTDTPASLMQETLSHLGETAQHEVEVEVLGVKDMDKEREVVRLHERLIEEEAEELKRQQEVEKRHKEQLQEERGETLSVEGERTGDEEEKEETKKQRQLKDISEGLSVLASDSAVELERERLQELKHRGDSMERKLEDEEWQREVEEMAQQEQFHAEQISVAGDTTTDAAPEIRVEPAQPDLAPELTLQPEEAQEEPTPELDVDQEQVDEDEEWERHQEEKRLLQQQLQGRIHSFIGRLEEELQTADVKIGKQLKLLQTSEDGTISFESAKDVIRLELAGNLTDEQAEQVVHALDVKCDGKLDVSELDEVMAKMSQQLRQRRDTKEAKESKRVKEEKA